MSTELRDAATLMVPALAATVTALDPPGSDAALVRLAEVVAATIDRMHPDQRAVMLGQTAPLLLKLLQELDERSRRRRAAEKPGRVNKVQAIRTARAATETRRRTG